MPGVAELNPDAESLGAVNTLVIKRDDSGRATVRGHNTDAAGFVRALREAGYEPADRGKTVVAGAGGAARAVVFGLLAAGAEEIVVLNRTLGQAEGLVTDLARHAPNQASLRAHALTEMRLEGEVQSARLLVNATSVGMWPNMDQSIWPQQAEMPAHLTVFDLVYNPLETRLLQQVRRSGARAIDGLGMLVAQGVLAFDLWTESGCPFEEIAAPMRVACSRVIQTGL
jgi:shikimate dehydrogenase